MEATQSPTTLTVPGDPETTDTPDDEVGSIPIEQPEEMDLADWLSARDVAELVDFFVLHNGKRIKIAAITDREENTIRKSCLKINPQNPKGPRRLDATAWRQMLIAVSINKASGKRDGDAGFVTPTALAARPTGELTSIQQSILKLSGWSEEDMGTRSEDATAFFG
jgi:hypothetical protein